MNSNEESEDNVDSESLNTIICKKESDDEDFDDGSIDYNKLDSR